MLLLAFIEIQYFGNFGGMHHLAKVLILHAQGKNAKLISTNLQVVRRWACAGTS